MDQVSTQCQLSPVSGYMYLCDTHSHQHDPSTLEPEPAEAVDTVCTSETKGIANGRSLAAPRSFCVIKPLRVIGGRSVIHSPK
jgi:hypothetical protein